MRIGVDIDGVLACFGDAFVGVVNEIWPARLPVGSFNTKWDWSDLGLSQSEVTQVWTEIKRRPSFWLTLHAYQDNVRALRTHIALRPHDEVYYVTARIDTGARSALAQTQRWLNVIGIGVAGTTVIVVDHKSDKIKLYKILDIQLGVDDYLKTAQSGEGRIILLDRPYNREGRNGVRVVKDLWQFFRLCRNDAGAAGEDGHGEGL